MGHFFFCREITTTITVRIREAKLIINSSVSFTVIISSTPFLSGIATAHPAVILCIYIITRCDYLIYYFPITYVAPPYPNLAFKLTQNLLMRIQSYHINVSYLLRNATQSHNFQLWHSVQ